MRGARSYDHVVRALVIVLVGVGFGGCREREPSTQDKQLDVQLAQAKERQAEAEAEKAAIEARAKLASAPATAPNPTAVPSAGSQPAVVGGPDPKALALLTVKKLAYEAFGEWSQSHPDKACPEKLEDLTGYLHLASTEDPWGQPYKMYCGQNLPAGAKGGLAVLSTGPDGRAGTDDDIKSW